MAEKLSVDEIMQSFDDEREQHYKRMFSLRTQAWDNKDLSPLEGAVLGITGSSEALRRYRGLAQKIGEFTSQAMFVVETDAKGSMVASEGGIIAGGLLVGNHMLYTNGNGYVCLDVPVSPFVAGSYDKQGRIVDATEKSLAIIQVAHIFNSSRNASSLDNLDHYSDRVNSRILIGRQAIYTSEFFAKGLNQSLLNLEDTIKAYDAGVEKTLA